MTVLARRSSLLLLGVALACLAAVLAVNAQQASSASTYKTCSLSSNDKKPNKHGPTYLKKLRVKGGPSCSGAKDQVKKYYVCRTKGSKPKTGKCNSKIDGYSCNEARPSSTNIATSFDARVTCTKGSRGVKHSYQQFKD